MRKSNKIILILLFTIIFNGCMGVIKDYSYFPFENDRYPEFLSISSNSYVGDERKKYPYIRYLSFYIYPQDEVNHPYKGEFSLVKTGKIIYKGKEYIFTNNDLRRQGERQKNMSLHKNGILIPLGTENYETFVIDLGKIKIGKDIIQTYPIQFRQHLRSRRTDLFRQILQISDTPVYDGPVGKPNK